MITKIFIITQKQKLLCILIHLALIMKKRYFYWWVMILGLRKNHTFWNSTFKIPKKLLSYSWDKCNLKFIWTFLHRFFTMNPVARLMLTIPLPRWQGCQCHKSLSQVSNSRSDSWWSFLADKEETLSWTQISHYLGESACHNQWVI